MTLQSPFVRAAVAGLFSVSLAGCATLNLHGGTARTPVMLQVDNHNDQTFNVYAVSPGGSAQRIGMVMSFDTEAFKLPVSTTVTGSVQIVAIPIGGFGVAGSGALTVSDGDTIDFTIQQVLAWSTATVH